MKFDKDKLLWTTDSNDNPTYIGIKIDKDDLIYIGWIKLEFDVYTGMFKIVDKQISSEKSIIVDR